jgi:hypothetical protein
MRFSFAALVNGVTGAAGSRQSVAIAILIAAVSGNVGKPPDRELTCPTSR